MNDRARILDRFYMAGGQRRYHYDIADWQLKMQLAAAPSVLNMTWPTMQTWDLDVALTLGANAYVARLIPRMTDMLPHYMSLGPGAGHLLKNWLTQYNSVAPAALISLWLTWLYAIEPGTALLRVPFTRDMCQYAQTRGAVVDGQSHMLTLIREDDVTKFASTINAVALLAVPRRFMKLLIECDALAIYTAYRDRIETAFTTARSSLAAYILKYDEMPRLSLALARLLPVKYSNADFKDMVVVNHDVAVFYSLCGPEVFTSFMKFNHQVTLLDWAAKYYQWPNPLSVSTLIKYQAWIVHIELSPYRALCGLQFLYDITRFDEAVYREHYLGPMTTALGEIEGKAYLLDLALYLGSHHPTSNYRVYKDDMLRHLFMVDGLLRITAVDGWQRIVYSGAHVETRVEIGGDVSLPWVDRMCMLEVQV